MAQLPRREVGFSICKTPSGGFVRGPVAIGTPISVNIPVACPPGSQFYALGHTHPGGVPFPSDTDKKSGLTVQAQKLCIVSDRGVNCFGIADHYSKPLPKPSPTRGAF